MTDNERKALEIIDLGEPFEESWFDEGDVESGPMGDTTFGYRHGDDVVELTRNGSVLVYTSEIGQMIYSSSGLGNRRPGYIGIGKMIADHLRAIESNAHRNGLDFVKTGRRPAEGYYSLDEILKRENALRSAS